MKTVSLLLIAATVLCGSQSNAQFSDLCLSQSMREVPITLQIKRAAGLAACSDDGLLALPQLASEAEEQIISKYQPSPQYSSCRLVSLEHTSCESLGRRGQRILIHYKANITCSDGCYYLSGFNQKDSDAISLYLSQVDSLVDAVRAKPSAEFNYGSRLVEIFYFRGRKEGVFSACSGVTVQNGVNKKIPACRCPSNCSNPCTLPAEPGRCRGRFPRYYHNSDSGQCELFTYGGCDGNQNRFNTQEECETACKVCPSGKVYLECGTDCPDTCENKDVEIRICNLRCVQGCFCPAGTVELGDECVAPDECPSTNTTAVEEECPEGKIYKQCGSACPVTCDNKDETINCITVCAPGCFCPAGTVELGDKCVAPEECPSTSTTAAPEKQCSAGMVYEECGTACPTTCENKDELLRPCTLQCVQGCFCPADKVLLEEDGETKCVDREECPSEVEECPEGKIYKECGTACPLTCENKDDDIICTKQCVPGCFCPSGYVERGNSCVTPKECDAELCSLPPETGPCKAYFPRYFYNTTSEQCEEFIYGGCRGNGNNFQTVEECEAKCNETEVFECLNGKEYQECGTSCPITCENKDEIRICTLECVQGCFCPADTVELDDKCVAPEECPSTNTTAPPEKLCPQGMVYEECGTACPTTCENKDVLIRPCTLQCVQGCFCPADKVLLEEDGETKCVDREECPSEVEECSEGKIYKECGTACPLTCENKDDDIICTKQCVPGCFCPSGYVERGNSCVTPKECDAELCSLPPETGPCRAAFRRYFYNTTSEQCEQFIYGGCLGNENNFQTVEECEAKCNETAVFECPNGKEYQECGTSCPTTCENKDEIRICTLECVQGCFCPAGTVELDDKCVTPEECPSTNTTAPPEKLCPQGMVYEECGTACPTTCDNKDVLVRPCTLQCVQGCFCAGDSILLEEEGDKCVTRDQCPA